MGLEKIDTQVSVSASMLSEKEQRINADVEARLAKNPNAFPRAVYYILPNEFGERFTYYALSAFINRYLQFIGASAESAKVMVHAWKMITYFCPLIGAAVSDSFLGKYKTIVYLSVIYLIGNIVLVITSIPVMRSVGTVSIGLYLVAFGTGGIKPCVGPHGGDQFLKSQADAIRRFFSYFYIAINCGSLLTGFVTPAVKDNTRCWGDSIVAKDGTVTHFCYMAGFILPTVVFFLAFVVFVYGERHYRIVPPVGEFVPLKVVLVIADSIKAYFAGKRPAEGASFFSLGSDRYGAQFAEETGEFMRVLWVIFPISFVWMVYDQQSTEWQGQYDRMDQVFFGMYVSAETFTAVVNPVLIVLVLWLLATFIYPALEKVGLPVTALRRMIIGSLLVAVAFLLSGFLQTKVIDSFDGETDAKGFQVPRSCKNCVHAAWQFPQWIILSIGEAMFSPTGNEFAYSQSPDSLKAMTSSFWLLLVAIGNFLVVALEGTLEAASWASYPNHDTRAGKYYFYSALCGVAILWLTLNAYFYKYKPGTANL
ncbi:hypothetical protein H9P43_000253 [Blastocladiella emersonii ATCC 22665]|nr:hypothetical protein H9P43_000253 [Blastocladiella emersonii ATCC 22665]